MATSSTVPGSMAGTGNAPSDTVDQYEGSKQLGVRYLGLPPGAPSSGQVPVATGAGTATAWGTVTGSGGTTLTPTAIKTGAYTAAPGDFVGVDTTSAAQVTTLPSAPADKTVIGVKLLKSATPPNFVTVAAGGSDTFNDDASVTQTLKLVNQSAIYQYEASATAWIRQSGDLPMSGLDARQALYYLDSYAGTDDAKMASALTALFAASPAGGAIVLSPRAHTFANQWTTSYVSSSVTTALKIQGAGVAFNGAWGAPSAATKVTFTYSGAGTACIDMQHNGSIEITGCQIASANAGVPLFQTTNATPNLHDNIWSGGGSGATCVTDAILLGGTGITIGAGDTAKYNAYQGQVYRNFFDGIRRACFFQSAANSALFYANTVSVNCGSSLVLGACIEFQGNSSKTCTGNQVFANCIECTHYSAPVKLTAYAQENTIGPNGLFDIASTAIAHHYFGQPGCGFNTLIDGYHSSSAPLVLDFNQSNRVTSSNSGQLNTETEIVNFVNRSGAPRVNYFGESPWMIESTGNQAYWRTSAGVNPYPVVNIVSLAATQFSDGNVTSGSSYVTSATATFVIADVGLAIGGTGIQSLTIINWAFSATTAITWAASFASNLGDVIRPTTSNTHLYQCTTAGTTGSSQPTWPTSGGTVTDGTAVWTDLGTGVTGCVVSIAPTATNTGVTLGISRAAGTAFTMTGFSRHHIVSTGTAPAIVANAGAGTGATATVTGNDLAMLITLNTGTGPASGQVAQVNYNIAYTATPKATLTPANAAAAAAPVYIATSTGALAISAATALTASTTYIWQAHVIQ